MADIGKSYRTDKVAEKEGVWVELNEGMEVKVARLNNPTYQRIWEREMRPFRAQFERGLLADDKMEQIIVKVMSECILIDWKNIEFDGKKLPHSVENAAMLMSEFPDFRSDIMFLASQQATFRAEEIAEAEKN